MIAGVMKPATGNTTMFNKNWHTCNCVNPPMYIVFIAFVCFRSYHDIVLSKEIYLDYFFKEIKNNILTFKSFEWLPWMYKMIRDDVNHTFSHIDFSLSLAVIGKGYVSEAGCDRLGAWSQTIYPIEASCVTARCPIPLKG